MEKKSKLIEILCIFVESYLWRIFMKHYQKTVKKNAQIQAVKCLVSLLFVHTHIEPLCSVNFHRLFMKMRDVWPLYDTVESEVIRTFSSLIQFLIPVCPAQTRYCVLFYALAIRR